jgi:hypothetical protein
MVSSGTPTWNDFYLEGIGPHLPLSGGQRAQGPSGVLPSGEGGGFDFRQSGINHPFPYPYTDTPDEFAFPDGATRADFPDQFSSGWWDASGSIRTYGPDEGTLVDSGRESGIFHFNDLLSQFSNADEASGNQITDFTIFNPYVHHQGLPANRNNPPAIQIPYLSTYLTSIDFNAYSGPGGFGG